MWLLSKIVPLVALLVSQLLICTTIDQYRAIESRSERHKRGRDAALSSVAIYTMWFFTVVETFAPENFLHLISIGWLVVSMLALTVWHRMVDIDFERSLKPDNGHSPYDFVDSIMGTSMGCIRRIVLPSAFTIASLILFVAALMFTFGTIIYDTSNTARCSKLPKDQKSE